LDRGNVTLYLYNEALNRYNEPLNQYNESLDQYNESLDQYNESLNQYNESLHRVNVTLYLYNEALHRYNEPLNQYNGNRPANYRQASPPPAALHPGARAAPSRICTSARGQYVGIRQCRALPLSLLLAFGC
jgi:hypothetical protein